MMAILINGKMYCDGFMCKDHANCPPHPAQMTREELTEERYLKLRQEYKDADKIPDDETKFPPKEKK